MAGLLYSRKKRNPVLIALFVCASLFPLMAVRHTPLFSIGVGVLLADHLGDAWDRLTSLRGSSGSATEAWPGPWLTGLNLVGAMVMVASAFPHFRCIEFNTPSSFRYPVHAIALLKESGISGNLAIQFEWGEYALWYLGPRIKVSMDGRRETVYSNEIYREYLDFSFGRGDWDALLREYGTQLVLVSKEFPVINLMRLKPDWLLIYEGPVSGLFVEKGSPAVEQIEQTHPPALPNDGSCLCFP